MALEPNLAGLRRLAYVVAGLGLMAWGFSLPADGFSHFALPVLGALLLLEGLVAY